VIGAGSNQYSSATAISIPSGYELINITDRYRIPTNFAKGFTAGDHPNGRLAATRGGAGYFSGELLAVHQRVDVQGTKSAKGHVFLERKLASKIERWTGQDSRFCSLDHRPTWGDQHETEAAECSSEERRKIQH